MLYLQEMQTWSRGAETSPQVRPKSCSKSLETKMAKVWHWTDAKKLKSCSKSLESKMAKVWQSTDTKKPRLQG